MENTTDEKTIRDSSINGLNKVLISFMQTLCILSNMDLQWPLTVRIFHFFPLLINNSFLRFRL